jgi:predicted cupin superfamily sugar epimerase
VKGAIWYPEILLEEDLFSAFHKLKSDELLQFYSCCSMIPHIIETDVRLGPNIDNKETFQAVVKSGSCGLLGASARHC